MRQIRLCISALGAGIGLVILALWAPAAAADPEIDRTQCAQVTKAFTDEFNSEAVKGKLSQVYVDSVIGFITPDRTDANCAGPRVVVTETATDHSSYVRTYMNLFRNGPIKLYDLGMRERLSETLLASINSYAKTLPLDPKDFAATPFAAVGLQFDLVSLLVEAKFEPEQILRAAWDTVEFDLNVNDLKTMQDNATIWKYDTAAEATSLSLKAMQLKYGG